MHIQGSKSPLTVASNMPHAIAADNDTFIPPKYLKCRNTA
jgi:hypothetical protein